MHQDNDADKYANPNSLSLKLTYTSPLPSPSPLPRPLRILPLGDSITYGWWSKTLNGYRKYLRDNLHHAHAIPIHYLGSQTSGNMSNPLSEGWPGATIDEIKHKAHHALHRSPKPDVILLHAGTNDATRGYAVRDMLRDLDELLALIFHECPEVAVVVSQIIMNTETDVQERIEEYNGGIPGLVGKYEREGRKIVGVEQGDVDLNGEDKDQIWPVDSTHPGDEGFKKMARNFEGGIVGGFGRGWFVV